MGNSILLIGNTTSKGAKRLKIEAEKIGLKFDCLSSHKVELANDKLIIKDNNFSELEFLNYDTYYFRGIGIKKLDKMKVLAKFLKTTGKRVVEKCLPENSLPIDKFVPESKLGIYKVPKSILTNKTNLELNLKEFTFPVVGKIIDSSLGQGVARLDSLIAAQEFSLLRADDFLLQAYFQIEYDTRILVVGGKVLGGFNRFKKSSSEFLTTKRGGKRELAILTNEQIAAAVEATKLQNLEIAGVDLFMVGEQIYIIEVNASPQFGVFEKVTGLNVAEAIIKYII
jgi:RimK-like ATP-grasp domain